MFVRRHFLSCALAAAVLGRRTMPAAVSASLSATPHEVKPGDPVLLEWSSPGAATAYLLGHGRVEPTGRKQVTFNTDTTVFFVFETDAGPVIRAADIKVSGVRGDESEYEENLGSFRHPYPLRLPAYQHYGEMMDALVTAILDRLGALQRRIQIGSNTVNLQSSRFRPTDLQANLPPAYFGRRISYLLEVPGPAAYRPQEKTEIIIKSLIEFRRRLEPAWYPERDDDLYQGQTLKLAKILA